MPLSRLIKNQNQNFQKHFFNKRFFERFDQFLTQKNEFESTNFEMFEEVVHNFGESDDGMI